MKKINKIVFDEDHFEDHDGVWAKDGILHVNGYIDEDGVLCITGEENGNN